MEINDVFGIQPVSDAIKETTVKLFHGLETFLSLVFKPGLEEVGYMLKDKVRLWRLNNIFSVLNKAKDRLEFDGKDLQIKANPRVGLAIIEESSMVDDSELQEMWAGLFASSCSEDGKDDSNIIFVDLLKRISMVEARILKYACEKSKKKQFSNGLIISDSLIIALEELKKITNIDDIYRLDRELDHLSSLNLISGGPFGSGGGFYASDSSLNAEITPSALALNLYYKTNSIGISPAVFWKESLSIVDNPEEEIGKILD